MPQMSPMSWIFILTMLTFLLYTMMNVNFSQKTKNATLSKFKNKEISMKW